MTDDGRNFPVKITIKKIVQRYKLIELKYFARNNFDVIFFM